MAELLRMENVSKCFGSFYANQDVNLTVGEGEVHTLLGENGAGKSTLMNVLIGLYQPTEGKIYMHGKEVHISSPGIAVEQAAARLDAEERAAGRDAVDPQLFAGICADLEREGFFRQEDGRLFA